MNCNLHHYCTLSTIDDSYRGEGARHKVHELQQVAETCAPCAPLLQYTHVRACAKRVSLFFLSITFYREKGSQGSLKFEESCFYDWFSCDGLKINCAPKVLCGAFGKKGAGGAHDS